MYLKNKKLVLVLFVSVLSNWVFAQNKYNSPYSSLGNGEIEMNSSGFYKGMNGAGLSLGNEYFINSSNPAMLPRTKSNVFEFGLRGVKHNVSTLEGSSKSGDASLDFLMLGMPISKKWYTLVALQPLTRVNYNYNSNAVLYDSVTSSNNFNGSGGLAKLNFSNGYQILHKEIQNDSVHKFTDFSIGLESDLIFGSTNRQTVTNLVIDSVSEPSKIAVNRKDSYTDFQFKAGAVYSKSLPYQVNIRVDSLGNQIKQIKGGLIASLAGVYSLGNDVATNRVIEIETQNKSGTPIDRDTVSDQKIQTRWPSQVGFGISIEKPKPVGEKYDGSRRTSIWGVGLDAYFSNWSQVSSYLPEVAYTNSYKVIVGGYISPDFFQVGRFSHNYFKRWTYKAGLAFEKLPYTINGENINEISATLGFSIPIGQIDEKSLSNKARFVNLAFTYGVRGKATTNLAEDRFYNVAISFAINQKWFVRRKYGL